MLWHILRSRSNWIVAHTSIIIIMTIIPSLVERNIVNFSSFKFITNTVISSNWLQVARFSRLPFPLYGSLIIATFSLSRWTDWLKGSCAASLFTFEYLLDCRHFPLPTTWPLFSKPASLHNICWRFFGPFLVRWPFPPYHQHRSRLYDRTPGRWKR